MDPFCSGSGNEGFGLTKINPFRLGEITAAALFTKIPALFAN
jgi:hypothetical protein